MKKIFLAGLAAGFQTTWTLGKVIFPVTLLVTLLQHTPVMDWLVRLITPVMGLFGLSGEAAIPLVLGNMLNLYAGIAGILTLDLSVKEVFILAVMLSFCHNFISNRQLPQRLVSELASYWPCASVWPLCQPSSSTSFGMVERKRRSTVLSLRRARRQTAG